MYEAEVLFEELGVTPDDLLDEVWRPVSAVEVESQVLEDLGLTGEVRTEEGQTEDVVSTG